MCAGALKAIYLIQSNLTTDASHKFIEAVVPYVQIDVCMLPQVHTVHPELVATVQSHNGSRRLKVRGIHEDERKLQVSAAA